jgi:hypothetical protein
MMKYIISCALLLIFSFITLPGCSQNIINRGDVFPAVEQTISKPGPVRDDLIKRGLITFSSQTDNATSLVPGEIHFGEIEQLVEDGIYVIDEDGYLQFGPSYTPTE